MYSFQRSSVVCEVCCRRRWVCRARKRWSAFEVCSKALLHLVASARSTVNWLQIGASGSGLPFLEMMSTEQLTHLVES